MGHSILKKPNPAIVLAAMCAVHIAITAGAQAQNNAQVTSVDEHDAGRPPLGDLMTLTQLRHFKLWYAHLLGNWKLAGYELDLFQTTFNRIAKLYPAASAIAQANLIHEKTDPAMSELRQAISDKNISRFKAAYMQITSACNQCHQAAGVGFIVVKVPTKSPFSNQDFNPVP